MAERTSSSPPAAEPLADNLFFRGVARLLALTAARPGIVRTALWSEFEGIDWDAPSADAPDALWRVPASRMKLELDRDREIKKEFFGIQKAVAISIRR